VRKRILSSRFITVSIEKNVAYLVFLYIHASEIMSLHYKVYSNIQNESPTDRTMVPTIKSKLIKKLKGQVKPLMNSELDFVNELHPTAKTVIRI
jgi:hypothetical protein